MYVIVIKPKNKLLEKIPESSDRENLFQDYQVNLKNINDEMHRYVPNCMSLSKLYHWYKSSMMLLIYQVKGTSRANSPA